MKPIEYFIGKIINFDCLKVMPHIPDKSIDMILCDLPYGTTACKWDTVIPFEPLWKQYKRIIKDNGAIVLTASQPFTSSLVMSNLEMFRQELIWEKTMGTGNMNANKMPIKKHENIVIFYKHLPTYNPQFTSGKPYKDKRGNFGERNDNEIYGDCVFRYDPIDNQGTRYPISIIKISNPNNNKLHPTQKPVPLFEYLIKTYTNEGDIVLDNCIGSGTTALACKNTNRRFIGIELDKGYCEIARQRLLEVDR